MQTNAIIPNNSPCAIVLISIKHVNGFRKKQMPSLSKDGEGKAKIIKSSRIIS